MNSAQPVRALVRGLRLLETFAAEGASNRLRVVDAARATGLSPATTHRLLNTLSNEGYITQDSAYDEYRLGPRLFALARAAEAEIAAFRSQALPAMESLRDELRETVNLSVLDRRHIVYVDQVEGDRPVRAFNRIGNRVPAHASAAGKVLLAHESAPTLAEIVNRGELPALTGRTMTSPTEFIDHLEEVRLQGFALDRGEHDPEVVCVAAPIMDGTPRPAGALSVSGPAGRMERLDLAAIGRTVATTAARVFRR